MVKKTTKKAPARRKQASKKDAQQSSDLVGVLLIGDPHVDAKQPGFRTDNFAETILKKIEWSLQYATDEKLQPVLLGDLFDKPRGNPNWLIHRLIEILSPHNVIGIYGNHDCADTSLNENDSLSLLIAADCLRLISQKSPFRAMMNDREVFIGGSSYREPIPQNFQLPPRKSQGLFDNDPFAIWVTHHDIGFPGYDNARLAPHQITNVELLVNGHIHRRLDSVQAGRTLWMTPGNISRRSRSEAALEHAPAVTRVDIRPEDYEISFVEIPHKPANEVFIDLVTSKSDNASVKSDFVSGLAELTSQKTASGFGLRRFLDENIDQFETAVANVILQLADEAIDCADDTNA